jgi:hypothetical protein
VEEVVFTLGRELIWDLRSFVRFTPPQSAENPQRSPIAHDARKYVSPAEPGLYDVSRSKRLFDEYRNPSIFGRNEHGIRLGRSRVSCSPP